MRIGYNRLETEEYGSRFGAVILAAGLSSRMKAFKPLLPVDGMPAIAGLIESVRAAGIDDITVVTGYNREALVPVLAQYGVREAYNENYEGGMMTSVKAGLAKASGLACSSSAAKASANCGGKAGYLLMPVDCPLISVSVLRKVMSGITGANQQSITDEDHSGAATAAAAARFAVAAFEGKKGHPIYVPSEHIEEILAYEGGNGLAGITDRYADGMIRIETGEEGCVLDMDTPEGYEDIKKFVEKGFAREKLELLTARKKIFLVRHGETKQHDEPMFIGQYDVELSEGGRIAAAKAAEQISDAMAEDVEAEMLGMDKFGKEPMPAIERIYCSDLVRARETAEIIKDKVNKALPAPVEVRCDAGLREINLGAWDGRPVSTIRAEFPEEFQRRGRDMFAFKMRGMESFYDMQYRVMAAFREILRGDDARDIIIVAHSGVIRVLENNIKGLHVDDEWEPLEKGSFRILEPFPEQPSEKINSKEKPMNMEDMIMDSVLDYYE